MEIQVFPFVSIASCPVTSHHWGQSDILISTLPTWFLYSYLRPTQLPFSRFNRPRSLCISLSDIWSPHHPDSLAQSNAMSDMSHQCWAEQSELLTIPPVTLKTPSAFFSTQPHCWLCSHPHAHTLLCRDAFHHVLGVTTHQCQSFVFPLFNYTRYSATQFSSLSTSLWMSAQLPGVSATPLFSFALSAKGACILSKYQGHSIGPWRHPTGE